MSLPSPDFARTMKLIGHSDIGGRGDGLQLMVDRGCLSSPTKPWRTTRKTAASAPGSSISASLQTRSAISPFPIPGEIDYAKKDGHFGPHNLYENRPAPLF